MCYLFKLLEHKYLSRLDLSKWSYLVFLWIEGHHEGITGTLRVWWIDKVWELFDKTIKWNATGTVTKLNETLSDYIIPKRPYIKVTV